MADGTGTPADFLWEFRRLSALEESVQTDIDPRDLIGHKAVDRNGDKIGTVDEVYLDDATGQPEWAAVRTGIFGRDAFVPLTTSEFSGDELRVPYDKSLVKESPDFGVGQHLSPSQELQLYRYYGLDTRAEDHPGGEDGGHAAQSDLDFGATPAAAAVAAKPHAFHSPEPDSTSATTAVTAMETNMRTLSTPAPATASSAPITEPKLHPMPAATTHARGSGADSSAPGNPIEITCREERLEVTTEWHNVGTAKLRKYVTTEQVERRVPVVRERIRVERIPVGEAERAVLTEKEIAEAVEEVTLREERPAVRKYLAPIERVRLVVERYTDEEVVREELRREHVEVHDPTTPQDAVTPTPDASRATAMRPLV
ncbi:MULTISPECIES: PRC and DUF2382 domain-containing protein [unclassified Kitasatospora]|uniref:PRC and DUF2382 domain-containing protein n=1 Tax=unclassified Kitasatospora TaxID=2633591 RepID=UPI0033FF769A